MNDFYHVPVLLSETMHYLAPKPGGVYVDCTLGGGGHTEEILKRVGPDGMVIGIDQDEQALNAANERLSGFGSAFKPVYGNFRFLENIVLKLGLSHIDGILFDLGVSSPQLDEAERGFSYNEAAPLDMRMDRSQGFTAADIINEYSQAELAEIIYKFGEERWSRRIASKIVSYRNKKRIETTVELAEIIISAIPAPARRHGPHPARRTFQALRIAVNQELDALREALQGAVTVISPMGVICVITFHSLEDRIVKHFFKEKSSKCSCPPGTPVCMCNKPQVIEILTKKPVVPTTAETEQNQRARSAKLRAARKLPRQLF
jgi:16S rRNA (cytosine1402-N4)-methyltransferase